MTYTADAGESDQDDLKDLISSAPAAVDGTLVGGIAGIYIRTIKQQSL